MLCNRCGKEIPDDSIFFCPECGMTLEVTPTPAPAPKQQRPARQPRERTPRTRQPRPRRQVSLRPVFARIGQGFAAIGRGMAGLVRRMANGVRNSQYRNAFYIILAVLCMVPFCFASYRHAFMGYPDLVYWLLSAPMLLSIFFVYRVLGTPLIARELAMRESGRGNGKSINEMRMQYFGNSALLVAIPCFLIPLIINLALGKF